MFKSIGEMEAKRTMLCDFLSSLDDAARALGKPSLQNVVPQTNGTFMVHFDSNMNLNVLQQYYNDFEVNYYYYLHSKIERTKADIVKKQRHLASTISLHQMQLQKLLLGMNQLHEHANICKNAIDYYDIAEKLEEKQLDYQASYIRMCDDITKLNDEISNADLYLQKMQYIYDHHYTIEGIDFNAGRYFINVEETLPVF